MLTGNLMRVSVKGKTIAPRLISTRSKKNRELAAVILEQLNNGQGIRRRGEIQAEIDQLSAAEVDHKLVRGLAKVAMDLCDFEQCTLPSGLTPKQLRAEVFQHAAALAPIKVPWGSQLGNRPTREDVLTQVAEVHGLSPQQVLENLYGDRKEMQIQQSAPSVDSPLELLERYNHVLCQSLLLHASALEVVVSPLPAKWVRALIRKLKFHQLLFRVSSEAAEAEELSIIIDGPQSLLRQSSRYGMQLANFFKILPALPATWSIKATVLWGKKRKLKKQLELSSDTGLASLYDPKGVWRSNAELWFEERYNQKPRDWQLTVGELVVIEGQRMLVPDFCFQKAGKRAHLEIIGFWRKQNLRRLLDESPENIFFAVSRRLSGEISALPKTLASRVILFAEVIPVSAVIEKLDKLQ